MLRGMTLRRNVVLVVGVALVAAGCGSSGGDEASGDEASDDAAVVESTTSTAVEDSGQSVILQMQDFTLEPGTEGFMCQTFANPFGSDVDVVGWTFISDNPEAHHLLVWPEQDGQDTDVAACQMRGQDQILFGSQQHGQTIEFAPGVATAVAADQALTMRIHYSNPGTEVAEVDGPRLTLLLAAEGTVDRRTSVFSYTNGAIDVAAGEREAITQTITAPEEIDLVWTAAHMHSHGVRFTVTVRDEIVYDSDEVNNLPNLVFDPPLRIAAGETFSFTCEFQASPEYGLRFGGSLETDEMCNMKGAYVRTDGAEATPLAPSDVALAPS